MINIVYKTGKGNLTLSPDFVSYVKHKGGNLRMGHLHEFTQRHLIAEHIVGFGMQEIIFNHEEYEPLMNRLLKGEEKVEGKDEKQKAVIAEFLKGGDRTVKGFLRAMGLVFAASGTCELHMSQVNSHASVWIDRNFVSGDDVFHVKFEE